MKCYTYVCVCCSAELIYKEVVDYERQSQQSSTAGVNNHITGKWSSSLVSLYQSHPCWWGGAGRN